ncbi:Predicted dehydrogenase [Caldanaerobius fijiensis DSM 17918]|uniref:Predicted dehydrogenase n=1 Tax=Caldanaerobius fijiensis DSM 17918 TaxID=1121256 RepID=A0A1M4VZI6_9THEO|nr:Gfo/Idh/MocA family oxidoreductase [Caldanaerobius fijiensis]SHE74398.1 Predicted dehydrogenase [Caldanaerobius fijiensis DSM 17918]
MKKKLGFAIVGCGVISKTHARCISELPDAQLIAVADIIEERAKNLAEQYNCDYYTDYHELLKRDDIDVVNVTTPSGLHAMVGIDAAKAGKHVIVEKPIDVTLEKADALIKACREAGVKLCSISQHRFDDDIVILKKAVEEGKLGQLNFGGSHTKWYRSQEYYDSGDWRGTWELDGGGALMNQSIHYVDLLQYIMGPVEEVYAYCATRAHVRIEVEDEAIAAVKFKNGAIGVIEGNTAAYPGFCTRLDIYGSEGSVIVENDRIKEWKLKSGEEKPETAVENEKLIVGTSSADIWHNSHKKEIQDMIDAIQNDRDPMVTGEEGRKPLEIILAIYESARRHEPVKLPLK